MSFKNFVKTCDKILDWIPFCSTAKNVAIALYQQAHRVQKLPLPIKKTSWVDDIKIHALAKSPKELYVYSFPIVGNLIALACHAIMSIYAQKLNKIVPNRYLKRVVRQLTPALRKHSDEVLSLYLARHGNLRTEQKLREAMMSAIINDNLSAFRIILQSRPVWSFETIRILQTISKNPGAQQVMSDYWSDKIPEPLKKVYIQYQNNEPYQRICELLCMAQTLKLPCNPAEKWMKRCNKEIDKLTPGTDLRRRAEELVKNYTGN